MIMHQTDKDGSIIKIKRQLRFDSAVQQSKRVNLRDEANPTPQSLKALLESDKRSENEQDYLGYNNKDGQHMITEEDGDLNLSHMKFKSRSGHPAVDHEDDGVGEQMRLTDLEKTPVIKNIRYKQFSEGIGGSGSYFKLPWSSSGYSEDDDEEDDEIWDEKPGPPKKVNPPVPQLRIGSNLKMNRIDQLVNLRQIITQKQMNESMEQFRAPNQKNKPIKTDTDSSNENYSVPSKQGFNTEEKNIIYGASYLQRLGLPVPETVMKQKMLMRESQATTAAAGAASTAPLAEIKHDKNSVPAGYKGKSSLDEHFTRGGQGANNKNQESQPTSGVIIKPPIGHTPWQNPTYVIERAPGKIIGLRKEPTFEKPQPKHEYRTSHRPEYKAQQKEDYKDYKAEYNKMDYKDFKVDYRDYKADYKEEKVVAAEYKVDSKLFAPKKANQKYADKLEARMEAAALHLRIDEDLDILEEDPQSEKKEQIKSLDPYLFQPCGIQTIAQFPYEEAPRILTEEEKKQVYTVWLFKNLQDFNYWIQKSKSLLEIDFVEDKGTHKCYINLEIVHQASAIQSIGTGSSKKESKKNAMESLAKQIIFDDILFWEGVTSLSYIDNIKKEYQENTVIASMNSASASKSDDLSSKGTSPAFPKRKIYQQGEFGSDGQHPKTKFKVLKNQRKIMECLKNGQLTDALEKLSIVGSIKNQLCYKDYCYVWSHAVQTKNLTLMKMCLDVVHYRKFSPQMRQILQTDNNTRTAANLSRAGADDPRIKTINAEIMSHLGLTRSTIGDNIFETWYGGTLLLANELKYLTLVDEKQQFSGVFCPEDVANFSLRNSLQIVESLGFQSISVEEEQRNMSMKKFTSNYEKTPKGNTDENQYPYQSPVPLFDVPFFRKSRDIDSPLVRSKKDPYLQYLKWEDLNSMYSSLFYTDDPVFCLQACELIHTYAKIDSESLINNSVDYFKISKLNLYEEMFEKLLHRKRNLTEKASESYSGSIYYLGCNFEEELYSFKLSKEIGEILITGVLKLQEGDVCDVRCFQGGTMRCLVKQIQESPGQYEVKLCSLSPKENFSSICSLTRIISTSTVTMDKSKVLDAMCAKVSMFHSILKTFVDPINTRLQSSLIMPFTLAMPAQLHQIAIQNNLNEDQLVAVSQGSTSALTVISGTKQTGKFKVAACIVREWMEQSNLKVLVKYKSAHKARAFYELFMDDIKKNQKLCYSICLITDTNGHAELFKSKVNIQINVKPIQKLKRCIDESKIVIIGDVPATGGNNSSLSGVFSSCQFNRVVICEADQHREDDTWEFLIRNCNQCVLIGDCTSTINRRSESMLVSSRQGGRSILEAVGLHPVVILKQTKPSYQSLLASLHYRLFCKVEDTTYNDIQGEGLVIAVKGQQEKDPNKPDAINVQSVYNQNEINLVIGVANSLCKENRISLKSIKIVAATERQKEEIDKAAQVNLEKTLNVQTLDEDLGDVTEYLIYSGVICNQQGVVTSAMSSNYLSKMLQNTLQQFIFIGDIDLYAIDPIWNEFFHIMHTKNQVKFWGKTNRTMNQKELGQI